MAFLVPSPIGAVSEALVASVLFLAGLSKFLELRQFARAVERYRLIPPPGSQFVAIAVPVVETTTAIGLFSGFLMPWPAIAAISLLLVFSSAVAITLLRGHHDIPCGCFGAAAGDRLSWLIVARNGFLTALAGVAMLQPVATQDRLTALEQGLVGFVGLGIVLSLSLLRGIRALTRLTRVST